MTNEQAHTVTATLYEVFLTGVAAATMIPTSRTKENGDERSVTHTGTAIACACVPAAKPRTSDSVAAAPRDTDGPKYRGPHPPRPHVEKWKYRHDE